MKQTILYECEICGNSSVDRAYIEACEARGVRDPAAVPVGCLHYSGGFYKDCLFAAFDVRRGKELHAAHELRIGCWATRDNGAGDNVGGWEGCGGDSMYHAGKPSDPLPDAPMVARMLAALEKLGIKPTIWDGEKGVPLEEFK